MVDLETISTDVDKAKLYCIQLASQERIKLESGCGSMKNVTQLKRLIKALTFDIAGDYNDDTTQALYSCLLAIIIDFSATYTPDPDVVIPGSQIIIVGSTSIIDISKSEADLVNAGTTDDTNWYLPLLDEDDQPLAPHSKPVLVTLNGVSFTPTYDMTISPPRLYGFANNDATQNIIITVVIAST